MIEMIIVVVVATVLVVMAKWYSGFVKEVVKESSVCIANRDRFKRILEDIHINAEPLRGGWVWEAFSKCFVALNTLVFITTGREDQSRAQEVERFLHETKMRLANHFDRSPKMRNPVDLVSFLEEQSNKVVALNNEIMEEVRNA